MQVRKEDRWKNLTRGLHMFGVRVELSFCDEKFVPKQILEWIKIEIEKIYKIWV